jgi:hypothetical protein
VPSHTQRQRQVRSPSRTRTTMVATPLHAENAPHLRHQRLLGLSLLPVHPPRAPVTLLTTERYNQHCIHTIHLHLPSLSASDYNWMPSAKLSGLANIVSMVRQPSGVSWQRLWVRQRIKHGGLAGRTRKQTGQPMMVSRYIGSRCTNTSFFTIDVNLYCEVYSSPVELSYPRTSARRPV